MDFKAYAAILLIVLLVVYAVSRGDGSPPPVPQEKRAACAFDFDCAPPLICERGFCAHKYRPASQEPQSQKIADILSAMGDSAAGL